MVLQSESWEALNAAVTHSGCCEAAPAIEACLAAAASLMHLASAPLYACSDLPGGRYSDHSYSGHSYSGRSAASMLLLLHLVRVPASAGSEHADSSHHAHSAVAAQTQTAYADHDAYLVADVVADV